MAILKFKSYGPPRSPFFILFGSRSHSLPPDPSDVLLAMQTYANVQAGAFRRAAGCQTTLWDNQKRMGDWMDTISTE